MIRRQPTRIELTTEDIGEFDKLMAAKKDVKVDSLLQKEREAFIIKQKKSKQQRIIGSD